MSLSFRRRNCDHFEECDPPCEDSYGTLYIPIEYIMLNSERIGKEYEDLMHLYGLKVKDKLNLHQERFTTITEMDTIMTAQVYPTQSEVEANAVQQYAREIEEGRMKNRVIIARFTDSNYSYLVDGHHRFCAYILVTGRDPIPCKTYEFNRKLVL